MLNTTPDLDRKTERGLMPRSIFFKFLGITIPVILLLSAVYLSIDVSIHSKEMKTIHEEKITLLAESYSHALGYALWTFDEETLQSILKALNKENPDVCVQIVDKETSREWFTSGADCRAGMDRNVSLESLWKGRAVGTVSVYYQADDAYRNLYASVFSQVVIIMGLLGTLVLIGFVSQKIIIGRPLKELLSSIRNANASNVYKVVKWDSRDELGTIVASFNALIQRQNENELKLRESEEKYRLLFEKSEDPMWIIDNNVFVDANDAAARTLGYDSIEELKGRHPASLSPETQSDGMSSYAKANLMMHEAHTNGFRRFEWDHMKKDGEVFPVEVSLTRVPFQNHNALFCVWRDLSERKLAEYRLLDAIESISEGFVLFDRYDRFVMCNSVYQKMYPTIVNDLIPGMPFEELLRLSVAKGQYDFGEQGREQWLQERLALHQAGTGVSEYSLSSGQIILASDRQTNDGGVVGIRTDITKIKQTQMELEQAKVDAEQANKSKSEFLANMTHELRTPLTSILGSLGLIQGGALGEVPDKVSEVINIAIKNSERLTSLVNDILDVGKMESNQIELNKTLFGMTEFLEECIAQNAGYANAHRVRFVFEKPENGFQVFADRMRLEQVMANLLSNAAKFSPDDSEIVVSVERRERRCAVSVQDVGTGIPREFHDKIFGRFEQHEPPTNHGIVGTGLGLHITKAIIDLHGGDIDFVSEPGQGATFTFWLPINPQSAQT